MLVGALAGRGGGGCALSRTLTVSISRALSHPARREQQPATPRWRPHPGQGRVLHQRGGQARVSGCVGGQGGRARASAPHFAGKTPRACLTRGRHTMTPLLPLGCLQAQYTRAARWQRWARRWCCRTPRAWVAPRVWCCACWATGTPTRCCCVPRRETAMPPSFKLARATARCACRSTCSARWPPTRRLWSPARSCTWGCALSRASARWSRLSNRGSRRWT